jgi:MtN3 and saliva related transmembrane protein
MPFLSADTLGLLAAACTTFSFVPQVWLVYRTNNTTGISLTMFIVFCIGLALWLLYGFYIDSLPVILSNIVTLILAGYILIKKILHLKFEKRM